MADTSFETLIFRIENSYFGLYIDQVEAMSMVDAIPHGVPRLDVLLGYEPVASLNHPHLIRVRCRSGRSADVLVEASAGILEFKSRDLRGLPSLLDGHLRSGPIWAAALVEDRIVFLLDLERLPMEPSCEA